MDIHKSSVKLDPRLRITILAAVFLCIGAGILWRLFDLQVIKHEYYKTAALSKQLKEYQIEPQRGIIEAYNGDRVVSLVLNEERYTLFADPTFVKNEDQVATKLAAVTGRPEPEIAEKLKKKDTRYVVLAKGLSKNQSEQIDALQDSLAKGIGVRSTSSRTYPEKGLAAQVLGFVNDEGEGQYGIEGFMQKELAGKPGMLKAITDAEGVPLVANNDNIITPAEQGARVRLTLDVAMQRKAEEILRDGLKNAQSSEGSLIIMESATGAIKAMANWPGYEPEAYSKVQDIAVFNNPCVSQPLELGSVIKPFTMGTALSLGTVGASGSFFDLNAKRIDDRVVTNAINYGSSQRAIREILEKSLNTGVVYLLEQMGGGTINQDARNKLYDYLTSHYRFGQLTGVEQGGEATGYIPAPDEGFGLDVQYANMTFGQGMSITPIQLAASFNALVNGGTYYRPRLIDALIDSQGQTTSVGPSVLASDVISQTVSSQLRDMLESTVLVNGFFKPQNGYSVGGKTGTAQIPKKEGGYYEDKFNGFYVGYVGGATPEYIVVVRVIEPKIKGFAGSAAAAPIFSTTARSLIDAFNVKPD